MLSLCFLFAFSLLSPCFLPALILSCLSCLSVLLCNSDPRVPEEARPALRPRLGLRYGGYPVYCSVMNVNPAVADSRRNWVHAASIPAMPTGASRGRGEVGRVPRGVCVVRACSGVWRWAGPIPPEATGVAVRSFPFLWSGFVCTHGGQCASSPAMCASADTRKRQREFGGTPRPSGLASRRS